MPTRRNRLRRRKTQRLQRQRGGGRRGIRVDLAHGEYGPEFDKVQIEGIKKYRKLQKPENLNFYAWINKTPNFKGVPLNFAF